MRYLRCSLLSFLLSSLSLLAVSHGLSAQEGRITGQVLNEAGDALSGVAVSVVETRQGVLTGSDGSFTLRVEPGTYTLQPRLIGMRTESVQVTVAAGETVTREIVMTPDPLGMAELIVTATREERTQQEIPASVSVLSAEELDKFEPTSAADALRTVPGIHAEGGGGEVAVNSFVRGMPSGGQFRYQTLQADGMPLRSVPGGEFSAEDVFFRHDLNVQTLEVAKGGASTIFGISAPAGIINYVSKTGGDVLTNKVKFTVGQRDLYRVDFNSNGPLGEDYRFNLGGFYRADFGPRPSGLPSAGLQLKGNVTRLLENGHVRLYATYIDDRAQFFLPFAHNSQTLDPAIDENGGHNTAEAADFVVPTPAGQFESTMENGVLTKGARVQFEYVNELEDGWVVENKLRWMDFRHEFNIFIPFVPQLADDFAEEFKPDPAYITEYTFTQTGQPFTGDAIIRQGLWGRFRPTEDLANQFTLQKRLEAGNTSHNFNVGAYVSRTELTDEQIRPTGLFELASEPRLLDLAIISPDGGDTIQVTRNGISEASNNFFNRQVRSNLIAVYGGDEIQIGDRWRIDVGARFERQVAQLRVEGTDRFDLGPTLAEQDVVFGNGEFTRRTVDFEDVGGIFGITYAVDPGRLNVYANFSRGFRFPALGTFAGNVEQDEQGNFVQPADVENEQILQFEAGLKLATSQLSGTLAGFFANIQDREQTDIRIIDGQSVQIQNTVGETRSFGLEVIAAYTPRAVPGARVETNITVQDHEFLEFEIAGDDFSGNALARQPDFISNSSFFYERFGFDFMLNWHHLGSRFADDANLFELDSFDVLTLDLGYTFPIGETETLRVGLNYYNFNDSLGLTEGDPRLATGVDPAQFPFLNARPVLPDRFKITASYTF